MQSYSKNNKFLRMRLYLLCSELLRKENPYKVHKRIQDQNLNYAWIKKPIKKTDFPVIQPIRITENVFRWFLLFYWDILFWWTMHPTNTITSCLLQDLSSKVVIYYECTVIRDLASSRDPRDLRALRALSPRAFRILHELARSKFMFRSTWRSRSIKF